MRLVAIAMVQPNDVLAVSRPGEQAPVGGVSMLRATPQIIQVITVQPGDVGLGVETRLLGTDLVSNLPVIVRVPADAILWSPDPSELVLS